MSEIWRGCACLFLAAWSLACAASRPPGTTQPDAVSGYPVTITADDERRANAIGAWRAFAEAQGVRSVPDIAVPEFQPITATVRTIAPVTAISTLIRLPRIGAEGTEQTEEQTREALRRFIESARGVLGVDPADVSLVSIDTLDNGAKRARYRQKPFLYSLRGGYGDIEIVFAPDGRILELSSTAIPDADRLRRALAGVSPRFTAEQARAGLVGQTLTRGAGASAQTIAVTDASAVTVRELVIYPVTRADEPSTLEFHLAWEIAVRPAANAPDALIYVDAVRDEVIEAR